MLPPDPDAPAFDPDRLAAFERSLEARQADDPALVLDGAVDAARYAAAPRRVAWLLREPNVAAAWDAGPGGEPDRRRDLRRFYRERLFAYRRWAATGAALVRTSHGLLSGEPPPAIWEPGGARAFADVLRDVAVLNVNKRGGGSVHHAAALRAAADEWARTLADQLAALAPHVLLLGGTAGLLPPPFWRAWAGIAREPPLPADLRGARLVPLPHPAQTSITHRAYWKRAAAGVGERYDVRRRPTR